MTVKSNNMYLEELLNSFKIRYEKEGLEHNSYIYIDSIEDVENESYLIKVSDDTIVESLNSVISILGVKQAELQEEPAFSLSEKFKLPKGYLTTVHYTTEDDIVYSVTLAFFKGEPSGAITLDMFREVRA